MASEEDLVSVTVKWSGNEYVINGIDKTANVLALKNKIYQEIGVKPERQKLLGLKCKGRYNKLKLKLNCDKQQNIYIKPTSTTLHFISIKLNNE